MWREFVNKLTDPEEVQRLILTGQFALDKSDEDVRSLLAQAELEIKECSDERKALLYRTQVEKLVFQQKRALLQWFLDKDKGIVVTSLPGKRPKVDLFLRISSNLSYDLRNEKRKKEQCKGEKYP